MELRFASVFAALAAACGTAQADVVFSNVNDNGFFTPFTPTSPSSWKYGDSGWFGFGSDPGVELQSITLGLAVYSSGPVNAGTTDIRFTFNDGDPSGLVFGSSAQLHATTISNVALPQLSGGAPAFFELTIPLPGVMTTGGYNNVGWSIQLQNYAYGGNFGFQVSTASGQTAGFYTNNASFYNGSAWSLFSFGPDSNFGVANFVARIDVPGPGPVGLFAGTGLLAFRRRR